MSNRGTRPRALGVIPARGGSKRLPRKNVLPVAGKPLIAWTIEAAQASKKLTDLIVSSDDEEILEIAKSLDAPAPFVRPSHLAGDKVRNNDVALHALDYMEEHTGTRYDLIILLQPTCPIRDPAHIDQAVDLLWASEHPTLVSVKGPYKKNFPTLKAIRAGTLEAFCDAADGEDWDAYYVYNAAIYAVKRTFFLEQRDFFSTRQVPLVMDEIHSLDIDTMSDLVLAEAAIKYLSSVKKGK